MRKRSLETFKENAKRNSLEFSKQGSSEKRIEKSKGVGYRVVLERKSGNQGKLKEREIGYEEERVRTAEQEQEERKMQFDLLNKQSRDAQLIQQRQIQQLVQMNATMMQQQQQTQAALLQLVQCSQINNFGFCSSF